MCKDCDYMYYVQHARLVAGQTQSTGADRVKLLSLLCRCCFGCVWATFTSISSKKTAKASATRVEHE